MGKVLSAAEELLKEGVEVPVAAMIVKEGEVIGEGLNTRESSKSILGHAEINAIEAASKKIGHWNLSDCTIYVSLEPCTMCTGAILQSHISNVVFAAYDAKSGALGSRFNLKTKNLNVVGGILEEEAQPILKKFFENKR